MLLAVLTAVATISVSSTYAQQAYPDIEGDSRMTAKQMLLREIPITVWTDRTTYAHSDTIVVKGQVANIASGFPVTLTVISPSNNIVTIAQLKVNNDGSFGTTLSTAGALWKYDGTYQIRVQYGNSEKSNKALVEITGGLIDEPTTKPKPTNCGASDISADGHCIPYSITGGMVTGATINTDDKSVIIRISSTNDGTLTVTPAKEILDGIFMVLVDNQEWDDVEISGQKVTVMFPAGTEKIEIVGTFVVPEFGTIAALILAVAIVSIIAVSARSRLSIMPRY